jgi:hypothetical protein
MFLMCPLSVNPAPLLWRDPGLSNALGAYAQARANMAAAAAANPVIIPQAPITSGPSYCGGTYGRGSFQMNCQ